VHQEQYLYQLRSSWVSTGVLLLGSLLIPTHDQIINQSKNGYGNALLEGIENVRTKYFCIFNADGSFNPKEINDMLNLTNNYDFIFGSRYIKNGKSDDDTFLTLIGNYVFSKIGKIFFNIF